MKRLVLLCLAIAPLAWIGGCGQKGALYLPPKSGTVVTRPAGGAPSPQTTPSSQTNQSPPQATPPQTNQSPPQTTPPQTNQSSSSPLPPAEGSPSENLKQGQQPSPQGVEPGQPRKDPKDQTQQQTPPK